MKTERQKGKPWSEEKRRKHRELVRKWRATPKGRKADQATKKRYFAKHPYKKKKKRE